MFSRSKRTKIHRNPSINAKVKTLRVEADVRNDNNRDNIEFKLIVRQIFVDSASSQVDLRLPHFITSEVTAESAKSDIRTQH